MKDWKHHTGTQKTPVEWQGKQLLSAFEGSTLQRSFYYEGSTGFSIYFFRWYISQELNGGSYVFFLTRSDFITPSKCCTLVPSEAKCLCLGAAPRNQVSSEPQMRRTPCYSIAALSKRKHLAKEGNMETREQYDKKYIVQLHFIHLACV